MTEFAYKVPPLATVDPGARLLQVVRGGKPEVAAANQWPTLSEDAYHGLTGEFVRLYDPYTEADPAAVAFCWLASVGCWYTPRFYIKGGNTHHTPKIWPLITGDTSTGAKGTAIAVTRGFWLQFDKQFLLRCTANGLSTGEGLIKAVRDANGDDPEAPGFDEGVNDKRLWVDAPEFASVLERSRRDGNSLSATLREAYDWGVLQTMTSGSPLRATDTHIVIVPQITPSELVSKLTATDVANGLANRFMTVCSKMSKLLPEGNDPPDDLLHGFGGRLNAARSAVERVACGRDWELRRTDPARKLWDEEYHRRFAERADQPESPVKSLLARWHANAARMSVIYALLDGRLEVDEDHVRAALAAWDYVEASTRFVFGSEAGDRDLGRLLEYIDAAGNLGRTRSAISAELFQRNKTKKELDLLIDKLIGRGGYECAKGEREEGKSGRLPLVYRRTKGEAGD